MRSQAEKASLCAANNADLYHAIFRAHGLAERRTDAFWSSNAIAPPYYSNLTTLAPDCVDEQRAEIGRLSEQLSGGWCVKDGFFGLDLADLHFHVLFEASWIWAEPHASPSEAPEGWTRVRDVAALDRWQRAWKASGSPADRDVFVPALLSDADVHVYGRLGGDRFDAGCIANRSAEVVGISNVFSAARTPSACEAAIALTRTAFSPELPVVGFDGGEALREMTSLGFKPVGDLRIWQAQER